MKRNYIGEEFSDIKRKTEGNPKLQTLGDLYSILRKAWCKETAYPSCQKEWVETDPTYGQCAITAMLVYDMFGGTISAPMAVIYSIACTGDVKEPTISI